MSDSNAACVVDLERQIDIRICNRLHQQFEQAIAEGRAIAIDASHVERVDTAALQLLTAVFRDCRSRAIPIDWKPASEVIGRAAATIGLQNELAPDSVQREEGI